MSGVRQPYALAILGAMVLAAALRCYGLRTAPINFDEAATWYFARLPLADLWGPPALLEPNPPLYYLLVHGVVRLFGDDAWALRLVSVASGVLCVPLAAFVAARLGGRTAGIAAALLAATAAVQIVTSQDARAYALLTACALGAIASEIVLLDPSHGRRWTRAGAWAGYVVSSVLALYAHNTAVLMVAALNLVAVGAWLGPLRRPRAFAVRWVAANLVVAAAYAAWLPVVLQQSVHTLANFWLTVPTLLGLRYEMMTIYAQPYVTVAQPGVDALVLGVGLAGVLAHRRNAAALGLAAFVVLGVPAASWLISQWRPILNGKTLMWLVPVFLVFVALGCTRVRRAAAPATALLVLIQLFGWYSSVQARPDEAFPDVVALLAAQVRPGDAIYLGTPQLEPALRYYGWPRDRLAVFAPPLPGSWFRESTATPLAADLATTLARHPRIWLLTRSHSGQHHDLSDRLRPGRDETLDARFGRGRMRILELSLFELTHG